MRLFVDSNRVVLSVEGTKYIGKQASPCSSTSTCVHGQYMCGELYGCASQIILIRMGLYGSHFIPYYPMVEEHEHDCPDCKMTLAESNQIALHHST